MFWVSDWYCNESIDKLRRTDIKIILHHPTHRHGIYLHLFGTSLNLYHCIIVSHVEPKIYTWMFHFITCYFTFSIFSTFYFWYPSFEMFLFIYPQAHWFWLQLWSVNRWGYQRHSSLIFRWFWLLAFPLDCFLEFSCFYSNYPSFHYLYIFISF